MSVSSYENRTPALDRHGRGSTLARNVILNLVGQTIPLIVGVIAIPVVIHRLGTARFGLLSLAWIVLGYFSLFDLGMGRATTKFVAEALGRNEDASIPHIVWTATAVQVVFGLFLALAVAVLAPFLVDRFLNTPPALKGEAKSMFYVLAAGVPFVQVSASRRGVLEAAQRFDLVNLIKAPATTAMYLLPLLGVLLGFNLPRIVLLLVLLQLVVLLTYLVANNRVFPQIKGAWHIDGEAFRHLFSFGGWVTVSSAVSPIFSYLERFLIGSFLSVSALTFYAAPFEMIARVAVFPTSIATALFPAFSHQGLSDRAVLKEMFARPLKYLLFIMVPVSVIFVAFAGPILGLWLGKEFATKSALILQILVPAFFLNTLAYIPYTAVQGLGRPDLKAKLDLIELPIYVALCVWLIPTMGLAGAAVAKLCVNIVDVTALFGIAKRMSSLSLMDMFSERCRKALLAGVVLSVAVFLLKSMATSLVVSILTASVLVALYSFAFLKVAMDERDWLALRGARKNFLG